MSRAVPARRVLVMVWLVTALALGTLLAVADAAGGPLDDPDPAHQRPGFLDAFSLPVPAPAVTADIPAAGRRAVVFFERSDSLRELCDALDGSDLADAAELVIVLAGRSAMGVECGAVAVVDDPGSEFARAYAMRRPAGGGAPVGYAVVDSHGELRYRTLDPAVAEELYEVRTIVDAAP